MVFQFTSTDRPHFNCYSAVLVSDSTDTSHPSSSSHVTRLGADGVVTKLLLGYLSHDKEKAYAVPQGHQVHSHVYDVQKCWLSTQWRAEPQLKEGCKWYCHRELSGSLCSSSTMIRHGSWFQHSNLTLLEVLLLTYNFMWCIPARIIHLEHHFGPNTIADCSQLCNQTMLKHLERCSQRVGGINKIVKTYEIKLGHSKSSTACPFREHLVFSGVEHGLGPTFLVLVPNHRTETLMSVISH